MNNDLIIRIYKRTTIISLLVIGLSFFIFKNPKPIILAYIFGTIISMLSFKLLDNTINRAVQMPPDRAVSYSIKHYFLRYLIYFIVLASSLVADYLNFISALLGLMMVKIVIVGSSAFDKDFLK